MDRLKKNNTLYYKAPAIYWEEALPLGSGRLGAMLYSGTDKDIISMNEDTLWSGFPRDKNEPDAYEHYIKARDLALEGKYAKSQEEVEKYLLGDFTEGYLPMCDIVLVFDNINQPDNYERKLNLCDASVTSSFTCGGIKYEKKAFISVPERAMYIKLTSDKPGTLCFSTNVESQLKAQSHADEKNRLLTLTGIAPSYVAPNYYDVENPVVYEDEDSKKGMRFCGILSIEGDGKVTSEGSKLKVSGASEVTLRFCAQTSFAGHDAHPYLNDIDEYKICASDLEGAKKYSFEEAFKRHLDEYEKLYGSMELQLDLESNTDFESIPTDERLNAFSKGNNDTGLLELFFNFNRYLLIASSREKSQPANLQGIWNAKVRPPWSSNYTTNINAQMNYWGAEISGLSQLHLPLFEIIEALAVPGAATAKKYFNARGMVAFHNVDIWAHSTPVGMHGKGAASYGFWPMAAGWLCRHLYEHYEYSLDEAFLRNCAYPNLRQCALFFSDVLVENKSGELVFAPASSPENRFIMDGESLAICESSAISMSIIREVFTEFLNAIRILGLEDELAPEIEAKLPRLKGITIGNDGRVLEWNEELVERDPPHRHISHMYSLYPGDEIAPLLHDQHISDSNRTLIDAFIKSLDVRGDAGTGWSLCWKLCTRVRLCDGEHAFELMKRQLNPTVPDKAAKIAERGGVYPNLFDAHPPFQIDGNLGAISGYCEAFLQSTMTELYLTPAVPKAFGSCMVKGVRAKGRVTADIEIKSGETVKLTLMTDTPQDRTIVFKNERRLVTLQKDIPYTAEFKL